MTLEQRIHQTEADLFHTVGVEVDESFLDLAHTSLRVRLLAAGSGPPLVLLHGVSLSAAAWAPLFTALPGHRLLAVDLPGHGLSDPHDYRRGPVRHHARKLIDDVFDALGLDEAPVVGHSLGGMLALWNAAAGTKRISSLVAIGEPAVALPGAHVRMPLSLLTVPGLGVAVLRSPSPRPVYRRLLAQGLGHAEVAAAPDSLIEALRLSARRPENARTVNSLMHAIDRFRRPRPESVLTTQELRAIAIPTMFIWGTDAPYLSADQARPSIDQIPGATLHEVPGAHGPWLADTERSAKLIQTHLTSITTPTTGGPLPPRPIVVAVPRIRNAAAGEAQALEALQRRSSDVWEAYREQLAANPDAIELPQSFIDNGWVRVAVDLNETPVGFSVVVPTNGPVHELDGLFVEPDLMSAGVGRALVEDAAVRASEQGAESLEVTAGPAQGFYELVSFTLIGAAQTRFGPAVRMRRDLQRRETRPTSTTNPLSAASGTDRFAGSHAPASSPLRQ